MQSNSRAHSMSRWRVRLQGAALVVSACVPMGSHAQTALLPEVPFASESRASYARYLPFACSIMPARMATFSQGERRLTWRSRWPENAATRMDDSVANVTAQQVAVKALRTCLAQHQIATTATSQLLGLGQAWLGADDNAQASAAFAEAIHRWVRKPLWERAWLLKTLVGIYADKGPAYIAPALAYMKQLDALGAQATGFRIIARNKIFGVASAIDSLPFMEEQSRHALQLCRTLTGDAVTEWVLEYTQAVINQADLDVRRGNAQAAVSALQKALEELGPLNFAVGQQITEPLYRASVYGTDMPQLPVSYAFLPGQPTSTTTLVRPLKGKVSILIKGGYTGLLENIFSLYRTAFNTKNEFGSDVELVVLGQTSGGYEGRLLKAEEEAELFKEFFHTYMRMEVPVIVYDPKIAGKRDDGQLLREGSPNPVDFSFFTIIDKHGKIREAMAGVPGAVRLRHQISELIREP
jgi:hypothetical protein